jgi:hypothetical protein
MIVVTPDNALKRAVKRLTTATGATADFVTAEHEIPGGKTIDLVIFDARDRDPSPQFFQRVPKNARILYILRGESLARRVALFESPKATSLFCYDEQFDDDEFISTATKALRGDVFGLQKYFPWGVTTFTMLVKNYDEKSKAIDIMMEYAKMAGARGPVRDRVQLVADELMMNALYHAPTDDKGLELYRGKTQKELSHIPEVAPIEVQYGCSGRYFGISVRDGFGSLTRERALNYLRRAGMNTQIENKKSGAGLGLISVLQSVSKLIFNLDPGYSTEVIALFDMELFAKGMVGARSLHLFTAIIDENEYQGEPGPAQPATSSRSGTWLLAAILGAIVAALGTAYVMKGKTSDASSAEQPVQQPSITVTATPPEAAITLNGARLQSGVAQPIAGSSGTLVIEVELEGYKPWSQTIDAREVGADMKFFVDLQPLPKKRESRR